MAIIPAELETLFTLSPVETDDVSILWDVEPHRLNGSVPAMSLVLARIARHLHTWTFQPGFADDNYLLWSNDEHRAMLILFPKRGTGELRLHDTTSDYEGAWKYLAWLVELAA